ncbi:MAG: ATP synthase F0 subunit C [Culicoidibacterales bacterium]
MENSAIIYAAMAIGAALAVLPGLGVGIGLGNATRGAVEGIARQPEASSDITRTFILGAALTEVPGLFGVVIALVLLFVNPFGL